MSDSPLLRRARARLAKQRELERQRWETQPAALQKTMIRWMLRIAGLVLLLGLIAYRLTGGSFY
jgi:hypothetical protein